MSWQVHFSGNFTFLVTLKVFNVLETKWSYPSAITQTKGVTDISLLLQHPTPFFPQFDKTFTSDNNIDRFRSIMVRIKSYQTLLSIIANSLVVPKRTMWSHCYGSWSINIILHHLTRDIVHLLPGPCDWTPTYDLGSCPPFGAKYSTCCILRSFFALFLSSKPNQWSPPCDFACLQAISRHS